MAGVAAALGIVFGALTVYWQVQDQQKQEKVEADQSKKDELKEPEKLTAWTASGNLYIANNNPTVIYDLRTFVDAYGYKEKGNIRDYLQFAWFMEYTPPCTQLKVPILANMEREARGRVKKYDFKEFMPRGLFYQFGDSTGKYWKRDTGHPVPEMMKKANGSIFNQAPLRKGFRRQSSDSEASLSPIADCG
ncbi:hypothetical protein [Streptomyces sp. NPDC048243]|uniref:hypothetical protein n=1 Tax=Streptomyces sp. NPDC048243 TaxID=3365522 RepID=UPI003721F243